MNGKNLGKGAPPGVHTRESARELIRRNLENPTPLPMLQRDIGAAGARMSFPGTLLGKVSFDERLVLYSYQEDIDLAIQCAPFGKFAVNNHALLVHIETATGRLGNIRRGFIDVVNPIYVAWNRYGATKHRKFRAVGSAVRRTLRNFFRSYTAPHRKRFIGNLIGWQKVVSGQLEPEHVIKLSNA